MMAALVCMLWQCSSEDFSLAENNPKRNNSDFFKHDSSGGLANRGGVDYVSILEDYNDEHNFLATMPDQQGMPIWDKMEVVDTETSSGLMIPLSYDDETLSSILFAIIDEENRVVGVKNYDNNLLKNIVYNNSINRQFRERMFYTFMYVDNKTFENKCFTNIPDDLLVGQKYDSVRGRIKIKDFETSTNPVLSESGRMIFEEKCRFNWNCKQNKSWWECDHCNNCYTYECGLIMVWTDDDFPTTSGGGGSGGGGSTCTTCPSNTPPKDDCAMLEVFYRMKPECSGGTGDGGELPLEDPCEKTKAMLQKPEMQSKINSLYAQSKIQPPNSGEKAFLAYSDGSSTSPIIIGDEHSADLGDITGHAGYFHNHTPKGVKILSSPDIYKLFSFIVNQPPGTPVGTSFAGMVATEVCAGGCPDGYEYFNFLIRFNGTLAEAQAIRNRNYTEADLKKLKNKFERFEQKIRPLSGYSSQYGNYLGFKGLEEVFFNALDDLEIPKNKIILQRIDKNGTVYNITLDANGKPVETPCL